jgi:thiosulfate dehydrogenase
LKLNASAITVAAGIGLLYTAAIAVGLRVKDLSNLDTIERWTNPVRASAIANWRPPSMGDIPGGPLGDSIRRGSLLFNETPIYASSYAKAKVSCSSCHAEGGMQPFASPVVGLPAMFPMYNERAGRVISLEDRVQECFVRSQNGRPLDPNGPEMRGLVDYIEWLSRPQPGRRPFVGRGLVTLPDLKPDPVHGQTVYATQCAGCHGNDGAGRAPLFPPVWGADSFNDGAGMNGVRKMAAFVQHNMPANRMGNLSPQDAYDVAAFIHTQPRPAFNPAYKKY